MTSQPRKEALQLWSQLRGEFERYRSAVSVLPISHLKVQEDLRRYLCIRCAGFLEQVTFVVLNGYLEQKSGGPMLNFSQSWFRSAPNLTSEAFRKLIERFGADHGKEFENFLTPVRHESLSDLLAIRNDVAHGKEFQGQRLQPDRYINLCEEIYDWLVATFLGDSVEVLDNNGTSIIAYERSR